MRSKANVYKINALLYLRNMFVYSTLPLQPLMTNSGWQWGNKGRDRGDEEPEKNKKGLGKEKSEKLKKKTHQSWKNKNNRAELTSKDSTSHVKMLQGLHSNYFCQLCQALTHLPHRPLVYTNKPNIILIFGRPVEFMLDRKAQDSDQAHTHSYDASDVSTLAQPGPTHTDVRDTWHAEPLRLPTQTQLSTLPRNPGPHARVRQGLCYEKQGAPHSVCGRGYWGRGGGGGWEGLWFLHFIMDWGNVSFLTWLWDQMIIFLHFWVSQ